jgi:Predicted oxidoreductases (related to aryl-alcohol dehydrogenases)
MSVMKRRLGNSGIEVSAMGLGCWAIGGPFFLDGLPDGWGDVDDAQSIRAIHRALDLGVNFFDTADVYGAGHSERVLGQALKGRRDEAVIATKFGFLFDETTRHAGGTNLSPSYIRQACEASLRRLQTDYIDLYQCHVGDVPQDQAQDVWATLDRLVGEGKIRAYGLSTWDAGYARAFATQSNGVAIQHGANVLQDAPALFAVGEEFGLANIINAPLAMGLLSGKFTRETRFSSDDVRGNPHPWLAYFRDGKPIPEFLDRLDAVREILQSDGRTLVQGALAWLWARSPQAIPIPGFKTVAQVEENCSAMRFGLLTQDQMNEIERLLKEMAELRPEGA